LTYHFFEVIDNTTYPNNSSGGNANGMESIILRGYGFCQDKIYAARFLSLNHFENYRDSASCNRTTANPLEQLSCLTPDWGNHFADPATAVILRVGHLASSISVGKPGQTFGNSGSFSLSGVGSQNMLTRELVSSIGRIAFNFSCCIYRKMSVQSTIPAMIPARGGTRVHLHVADWDLPFRTNLTSDGEVGISIDVTAYVNHGHLHHGQPSKRIMVMHGVSTEISSNASTIGFTSPPGVGANLSGTVSFEKLPLLRFVTARSIAYLPPYVRNLTNTGPTEGGFDRFIYGTNFGGLDFGAVARFVAIHFPFESPACNSTIWHNDSVVECIHAPAAIGNQMQVFVEVGDQRGNSNPVSGLFSFDYPQVKDLSLFNIKAYDIKNIPTTGGVLTISGANFVSDYKQLTVTFFRFSNKQGREEISSTSFVNNKIKNTTNLHGFFIERYFECPVREYPLPTPSKIYCDLPPGTGSNYNMIVTVGSLSSATKANFQFSYGLPRVAYLLPSRNAAKSGNQQVYHESSLLNFNVSCLFFKIFLSI
jgi:hypothetical protein